MHNISYFRTGKENEKAKLMYLSYNPRFVVLDLLLVKFLVIIRPKKVWKQSQTLRLKKRNEKIIKNYDQTPPPSGSHFGEYRCS